MTEDRLSARERELLDDMRRDIDRLKRAAPSDLFTRDDPRLIHENKGLLQENSKLRQDLELMEKAQRPTAPARDDLVEWIYAYNDRDFAKHVEVEAMADAMLASDLFAQEPATGASTIPQVDPDDLDVTKKYIALATKNAGDALNLALQKEAMRAQRDSAQAERDRLRQHLKNTNEELAELQGEYDDLTATNIELKTELDKLQGDVNVSREAYRHMVASHNELSDLTIREFGSSVAEEGAIEAAIRLLKEQKKRIAELEQEPAHRTSERKGTTDSVVATLTDIASVVAAGIRKLDEK